MTELYSGLGLLVAIMLVGLSVSLQFSRMRLKKSQRQLQDRIKEAECMRDVSQILRQENLPTARLLQDCIDRIPAGWQYPELTVVRLVVGEMVLKTQGFVETDKRITADFILSDGCVGDLEVFLLDSEHPPSDLGFLPEEQLLLNMIASQITQTLRHREDQALIVASEQRYRAMVQAIPDMLFRQDKEGHYLDFHAPDTSQLFVPPEAFLGRTMHEIMPEELANRVSEAIDKTLQSGEISILEYQLPIQGVTSYYELRISRINDHEILSISRDVTHRYQIEAELRRSNAELEQFAYAVSHDMRQPLRMISGHLGILERSLAGRLDSDEQESMQFALEGAKRMDQMILSLLDYSRVGRKTEPMKWNDSKASLDEALGFLQPALQESQAELRVQGEWPSLHASRDELTRLMQNLIGNAIKYRHPNTPPQIDIHSRVEDKLWHVEICDNGIGIDPTQQDRLFKVFSRLHARGDYEGSGVGLALCRKIIEHHHGRIGLVSQGAEQGSCFWFEIPLESSE